MSETDPSEAIERCIEAIRRAMYAKSGVQEGAALADALEHAKAVRDELANRQREEWG